MNTKITRLFALLVIVGMAFVGCQKDDKLAPKKEQQENVVTHGFGHKPAIINGKQQIWEFNLSKKSRNKGVYMGHTGGPFIVEQGVAIVKGSSKTYVTMKVKRSNANGDYFFIMCENLTLEGSDYGTNYIAYDYDNQYAEQYGYCYDFDEAIRLSHKVYMELPVVYQGVEYTDYKSRCYAKLPSEDDIKILFEMHLGEYTYEAILEGANQKYYDAFVGGLGFEDESNKTFVGYADNMVRWKEPGHPVGQQKFYNKGTEAEFWTGISTVGYGDDSKYPLVIGRRAADYGACIAYIDGLHAKNFGLSVRYVFYPLVTE